MAEVDGSGEQTRKRLIALAIGTAVALVLIIWWLTWGLEPIDWAETTVPFDSACETDCEVVGFVAPGHRGPAVPLILNPNVDDPIAQWAGCIETFTQCMEATPDTLACMDQGSCPIVCKSEYARVASSATDIKAQLSAFQTVFLDEDAFCRPKEGPQ